jgi:hypothetical protein
MTADPPVKLKDGCLQEFRVDARGTPALVAANRPLAAVTEPAP